MKIKRKTLTVNTILLTICFYSSFGQINKIIPTRGIEGVPVVIDSSGISAVFIAFGTDFILTKRVHATYYYYDRIGLTFEIDPYDKNQIVRAIYVESPYKVETKNGIVLNKSTMRDVLDTYNDKGCFTSKYYARNSQKGISFYIKKRPDNKKYDANEKIYKIEINNNGDFGSRSRENFVFNDDPIKRKLTRLISILKTENFNKDKLDEFWISEKSSENEPYGLEKEIKFNRKIENNLTQKSIEINIVGNSYNLNIIKSEDSIVYLKLTDNNKQKTLIERLFVSKYKNTDFNIYTYGSICGVVGIPPKKCMEMLNLVKNRKYKELVNWLQSINPEISIYGYIGIEFLKLKGCSITEIELERMKTLRKSDMEIYTCRGCAFDTLKSSKNILTDDNLKQLYNVFVQCGYLHKTITQSIKLEPIIIR
ncbi:MAG: hypothetical protein N4A72_08310 [Bacteroidales bacterium]|jgi:hypothetical protein|nr:hypothetical protein [Bacteroidales bacterium]